MIRLIYELNTGKSIEDRIEKSTNKRIANFIYLMKGKKDLKDIEKSYSITTQQSI